MSRRYKPYAQSQDFLLPPNLQEWVAPDSLARFISDTVDYLDERGRMVDFHSKYLQRNCGQRPYSPVMLLKILIFGYCLGICSSRQIAQQLVDSIQFRYLSANQQPDFRTISNFRKNNGAAIQKLFVDILRICRESGFATLGTVSLDGRRVQSNASIDQNRDKEWIEAEVKRILDQAEVEDAKQTELAVVNANTGSIPENLVNSQTRRGRLQLALNVIEEAERKEKEKHEQKVLERAEKEEKQGKLRGRKPKEKPNLEKKKKANITDPDSKILKTRKGFIQGFNGQAMADCKHQIIVAQDVTQEENDVKQLTPMLDKCLEQSGKLPQKLNADAGYWSESNVENNGKRVELYIATQKDYKQREVIKKKKAPRGRIPKNATAKEIMERKLLTVKGKAVYIKRCSTIEPVFGQMWTRSLHRFLLRGINKVKIEWSLWCTTHNLLKLWRLNWSPVPNV
jgi:transposase